MLRTFFERSRYLVLIAVIVLVLVSLVAFFSASLEGVTLVANFFTRLDQPSALPFIELIDEFLIGASLLVFAIALYELFIGDLNVPHWMVVHHLHELKALLGSMIILIMSTKFLSKFVTAKDWNEVVLAAVAVALVGGTLIAFDRFTGHTPHSDSASEKH